MGPRTRAGAVLVCTFALGLFAGITFERYHGASEPHVDGGTGASANDDAVAFHERTMNELKQAVGLDDGQVAEIEAIMAKHRDTVQLAWQTLRPEVQKAMQGLHVEIAETLRPDQRKRFHEWLIRRREADDASHASSGDSHE